jgi:zinc and cadmium transporter
LSAGVFICISLSDLLPEVQFHSHDRARLTIALLAGVIAAYGVGLMEPEHDDFSHSTAVESHDRH